MYTYLKIFAFTTYFKEAGEGNSKSEEEQFR